MTDVMTYLKPNCRKILMLTLMLPIKLEVLLALLGLIHGATSLEMKKW